MKHRVLSLSAMVAVTCAAFLGGTASAVTFSPFINDDFESYAPGVFGPQGVWSAGTLAEIVTDDGSVFGSPNQYASVSGESKELKSEFTAGFGNVGFFKFDFFEADTGGNNSIIRLWGKENADGTGGDRRAVDIRLDNGNLEPRPNAEIVGAYSLETAYTLAVVANTSGVSVSYDQGGGVSGTLDHQEHDIWLAPVGQPLVLLQDDVPYSQDAQGPFTIVSIRTNSGGTDQVVHYDNVMFSAATVPEPVSLALCAIGGAALLVRRR